jgi:hypothetical protein
MALPRLLLQVIDPAQVYFDRHRLAHQRGERPAYWQAAVLGPDIEDEGRAGTDAERAELARGAARDQEDYEAALTDAKRRWAPQLQRAADQLLGAGATQFRLGDRTVSARIIRFWRGDHLLQTTTHGPDGGGESLSRISRDPRRGSAEVLLEYLARAATRG